MDQTYNIINWQTLFTWLWRELLLRLLKSQSPTTVLFRTTLTRPTLNTNYWYSWVQTINYHISNASCLKAHLHRRFLSQQLGAIFVTLKLHQVASSFKHVRNPCDMAATKSHWKSHLVYTCDFEVATLARQKLHQVAATKIACVNWPLVSVNIDCTDQYWIWFKSDLS